MMLINILVILVALTLLVLSLLHFYWAAGGDWGVNYTIPEKWKANFHNEKNKLQTKIATIIVALGLLCFATVILSNTILSSQIIPIQWSKLLSKIIGALFIARAIGDFNYFGLFKKKSDSLFAQKDTQLFVPLCLGIGSASLIIGFTV